MTNYYLLCAAVFVLTYCLNMTYISVFYHRGFTHDALSINPRFRKFIVSSGSWITGIDLKAWSCMHRMHHLYSDTQKDPHSPKRWGLIGTMRGQLISYKATLRGLIKNDPQYTSVVKDLDFDISFLNRNRLWALPYVIHFAVWMAIGFGFDAWLLGYAYFAGMMSHPIQGWLVNAFGHAVGYRNYAVSDDSRNNTLVAWFCFGEGFQNNHHRFPKSAKFSMKWFEMDFGWLVTKVLSAIGLVEILNVAKPAKEDATDLAEAATSY